MYACFSGTYLCVLSIGGVILALVLSAFFCSYLARTAPEDVARVESKTYICTDNERETRAIPKDGVKSILANWRDQKEMRKEISEKMNGCMKGTSHMHSTTECCNYIHRL